MSANPDLLTTGDVARRLGVTAETVRRWVEEGKLAGFKVGSHLRIHASEVDRFTSGSPNEERVGGAGLWDGSGRSRLSDPEES